MQRFREHCVLILIALLPFHALLVTVGTQLLTGPGHPPMGILAVWKEALLGVVLLVAVIEIVQRSAFRFPISALRFDVIDALIGGLVLLAVGHVFVASFLAAPLPGPLPPAVAPGAMAGKLGEGVILARFLYGVKYDFIPLIAFLILRRVPWSEQFRARVLNALVFVGAIVAGYGLLTLALPMEYFVKLGYSPLHSLYVPDGPLAAFQKISDSGIRRIQSTMSGANQLGLWLLIPLSAVLTDGVRRKTFRVSLSALRVVMVIALFLTFSRSAVFAFAVIVGVLLWQRMARRSFWTLAMIIGLCAISVAFWAKPILPDVFVRTASTRGHLERPLQAMAMIVARPLGYGLGAAGPASNRVSDACVHLGPGDDASWAADRTDLCVFRGGVQIQPTDRVCACPVLPENGYLQIGVELGVLGMALFLALTMLVISSLRATPYALLPFLGISVAALFLHAWEDSAVAYTVWILAAMYVANSAFSSSASPCPSSAPSPRHQRA